MLEEHAQEFELGASELHSAGAALDVIGPGVQREVVEGEDLARSRSAEERPQTRLQLLEREWLCQVVVSAGVEARHPVGDPIAGSQNQDGSVVAVRPNPATYLDSVHKRHQDIEHD